MNKKKTFETAATHIVPAATYLGPAETYLAPVATYLAPVATYLCPAATQLGPAATYLGPTATYLCPGPTYLSPTATYLGPASNLFRSGLTVLRSATYLDPVATYLGPAATHQSKTNDLFKMFVKISSWPFWISKSSKCTKCSRNVSEVEHRGTGTEQTKTHGPWEPVAYLLAWHRGGIRRRRKSQHIAYKPTTTEVTAVYLELKQRGIIMPS